MDNLFVHTDKGTDILTGVGRIVLGDCLKPQDKDANGAPLVIKTGPNAGQPRVSYYIGIAIPKTDPSWSLIQAAIVAEAKHRFPQLFDASGNCINPTFAYKFTDGDSTIPNTKNIIPSSREGFPGHFVLHFSNGFAPKCYKRSPIGLEAVTDPNVIKRGYYVKVYAVVRGNNTPTKPGVYLNTSMILMEKVGDEIFSGPAAEDVFGGQDVFGTPGMAPSSPVAPVVPGMVPPPVPQFPPAPDFAQLPPPPPAAPVTENAYNVNGVMCPHSQLIAAGWTEAQISVLPPF